MLYNYILTLAFLESTEAANSFGNTTLNSSRMTTGFGSAEDPPQIRISIISYITEDMNTSSILSAIRKLVYV